MPFIRRGDFDTACQLLDEFFSRIGLGGTLVQSATPVPTQPRPSPTPRPTPTPTPAPTELITHLESGDIKVTVFDHDAVYHGTTIFMDFRDTANPSLVEVDIDGRVTWEYPIPDEAKHPRVSGGPDVEWLPNGDILFVMPYKGVYQVKEIVWSYETPDASHDAGRLPNGNILMV